MDQDPAAGNDQNEQAPEIIQEDSAEEEENADAQEDDDAVYRGTPSDGEESDRSRSPPPPQAPEIEDQEDA